MDLIIAPHTAGQVAICIFIAIVFLQSGLDKVMDWQGNLSWLKDHFKATFLKGLVAPMLLLVTLIELASGIIALFGSTSGHSIAAYAFIWTEDSKGL